MFREYLHSTYQGLIRSRKPRSRRVARTHPPTLARLAVEGLEDRTLLSTLTLFYNGNVVYAPATNNNNTLSISENPNTQRYTIVDTNENITLQGNFINPSGNGTHTVSFWYGNISWFTVNMANQNFTVNIEQTLSGVPVYVNLGNGTDAVNVSPAAKNLDNIQGAINVHPGTGIDSLYVYDQSNPNGRTFSLGASSLSRSGSAAITYSGINFVTVNGGNGNNSYNVSGTEDNFVTNLNTGNGHDTVNVNGTGFFGTLTINEGTGGDDINLGATVHNLNNLQGTINVNGNHLGVDNLTVDDQANSASPTFTLNSNSITRPGTGLIQYNNLLNNVFVLTGTGGATVNVLGTRVPTSIVGHANSTVNIGNAGSVQQILGPLTITDPPSGAFVTVNVDDSSDSATPTVILDTNVIAGSNYGSITGLAPAPIQYKYQDTNTVTVQTGTGGATINALATNKPINLIGHGSNTTVNVGKAGSVQAISGALTISNLSSFRDTINVDDSADGTARLVTLDTVTIGGANYGRITGLAPAAIQYKYADTNTVTVQTGTGGATVNVLATGKPVSLIGHGTNTVNVGNSGSVQAISGPLTISGSPSSLATVNVDDSADGNTYTVTLDTVAIGGVNYGRITGLAPAAIQYRYVDTNTISIQTSAAGDLVNVLATNAPVNLIGHGSNTTVNVGNAGSVQGIIGPLTITDPGSGATINVDDSADGTARTAVTLDTVMIGGSNYGRITGLGAAAIQYKYADFYGVGVETGIGGATVNVLATGAWVNLIGNGSNTVNVGNAGSVQAINGLLTISGPPLSLAVNVNDSTDSAPRTVTLDTVADSNSVYGRITGLAPAAIEYVHADTNTATVQTGTGGGTVNVLATDESVSLVGHGLETVNVGVGGHAWVNTHDLTITDLGSGATINVDDSADGVFRTVTLDTVTIGGSDYGRVTGLGAAAIQYKYADTNTVTLQTGTGGATVNALATGKPVNLIGHGSNTTVNVGNAGSVQAIIGPLTITDPGSGATINVDDSADGVFRTVTLDTVTIGGANYGRITGLGAAAIEYKYADTNTVTVQTGSGGATVNVLATGVPVVLSGYGLNTTFNVGNAGSVQAIIGPLTITDPGSGATINVDDSADGTYRTVTLDTVTFGGASWGRITGLAPAAIQYLYSNTSNVTVQTGSGGAEDDVLATGTPVNLIGHGGSFVNVGNAGSVQAINAPLTITDTPSAAWVNVDDSADGTARVVYLDTVTMNGSDYGRITGLGSAPIEYKYAGTFYAGIQTGTAGGTVNVLATGAWVGVTVTASETVNVGNAGSVQAINGQLAIYGSTPLGTVNVDDSADGTARTVTQDTVTSGGYDYGRITGLAPAVIWYQYAGTSTVTVQTGSGGGTVNVLATGVPISFVGTGSETFNVGNAGSVQAINGPLTITGAPAFPAAVNVDDSADGAAQTVTLDKVTIGGSDYGRIAGLAPAAIQYNYAGTSTVTVQTGTGGAMVNALATGVPVSLIGNASGPISLFASDGNNTWNITSQNAGTLSSALLAGTVTFSGAPNLHGGNGADTFVFANGAGVAGTIDGGGGTNALDYSAYSSSVLVNLQTGFATAAGAGIANIQNVTGGTGGGAGVYNILVGNGGNVLTGGDGRRNLLIAGASASTLIGGNDDDILIGGTTVYDTQAGMVSLQAIMAYWSNTSDDYATRVANLLNGTGVPRLDATIVHNNGGGNTMTGNHGGSGEMNLFYGLDPTMETTDYNPGIGEQFINC
jgi:hypothetical protein